MENQIQNNNPIDQKYGETLLTWKFPEFIRYERGKVWYIIAGLALAASLIYAIITANFLFAVIILIAAITWFMQMRRNPEEIECAITKKGVRVGRSFYPYGEFKKFWVIYNPPEVKTLYFDFKNAFSPKLSVDLRDQNPLSIRETLLKFLDEDLDKEEESPSDTWRKFLKL